MRRRAFVSLAGASTAWANWPGFRGPQASGVADSHPLPAQFHTKWKTPVPGLGHASPTIWGERLFLATAVNSTGKVPLKLGLYGDRDAAPETDEQSWKLLCFRTADGKLLWEQTAHHGKPRTERHMKATQANTTLATDGKVLVAFFGSEGLHCYTLDGKRLWRKDLGVINVSKYGVGWGYASSPVIHGDRILLQCDAPGKQYLGAFRLSDGEEMWRTGRAEVCERCWATPFVHQHGTRTQVVANGWPYVVSYDFATGRELWRLKAGGDNPIPTPFAAHGLIYVANGHGAEAPVWAIRPEARGDITPAKGATSSEYVVWMDARNGAYIQTPLVYRDFLYSGTNNGVLKCYDARSGKLHYQQRLGDGTVGFSASPVAGDGKVFCASEDGEVHVIAAGATFERVALNRLDGAVMATPAIAGGRLFFRTLDSLAAVG